MRYRVIDTQKLNEYAPTLRHRLDSNINGLFLYNIVLSEEESLAKFKEIWDAGVKGGYNIARGSEMDSFWEQLKEKL